MGHFEKGAYVKDYAELIEGCGNAINKAADSIQKLGENLTEILSKPVGGRFEKGAWIEGSPVLDQLCKAFGITEAP